MNAVLQASRSFGARQLMRALFWPVVLTLLVLVLVAAAGAWIQQSRGEQQRESSVLALAGEQFDALASARDSRLAWLTQHLGADEQLQRAMQRGDREALLRRSSHEFEVLREQLGVSHAYFIDTQHRVLLRLHDVPRRGDEVTRRSLLAAAETGQPASELEVGTTAVPTLRHVMPWRLPDGRLIGYLELGIELRWFARELERRQKLQVFTALHKRATSPEAFAIGARSLGLRGVWDELANVVLLDGRPDGLPPGLLARWQSWAAGPAEATQFNLHEGKRVWSVALLPVGDRHGPAPASLALVQELGELRAATLGHWFWLGGLVLLTALLALGYLYVHVRRVIRQLESADRELRENEQRFRAFASDDADWWFWEMDAQLRFSYLSPNFARVAGLRPELVLGRTFEELSMLSGAPPPQLLQRRQRLSPFGVTLEGPDGQQRSLSISGLPVFAADGSFRGYRGTGRNDVQVRLAALAFESHDAMLVTDEHRAVLRVNEAFTLSTGVSSSEVVGRPVGELDFVEMTAAQCAEMEAALAAKGSWRAELQGRRKDGSSYPLALTISALRDAQGRMLHLVASFHDISKRKAAEAEIERLAFYDALTGLPNRRLLMDRLKLALAAARRTGSHGALLLIDLDNFKTLNDTQGHDAGDLLLKQVARRIESRLRKTDTVARLGGDEFVAVVDQLGDTPEAAAAVVEMLAAEVLAELDRPYQLGDGEFHSSGSIGIALFGPQSAGVDEALKHADLAMYESKAQGRGRVRFFDPTMQLVADDRARKEADLRRGLQHGEFELYYQAQIGAEGRVTGAEALLRWNHPERGLLPAAEFVPLAEQSGLILPLGHWALEQACRQLAAWAADPARATLTLAVNVGARQFRQPGFVTEVQGALARSGAHSCRLMLDLTERPLTNDVDVAIAKMSALRACGVSFALDDFGTGHASLNYLKRLPLDQIKIDPSFVRNLPAQSDDAAIVRSIVTLSRSLGLDVIAEGVETEAQRASLLAEGCPAQQGFLYAEPLPLAAFEQLLASGRPLP